MRLTTVFRKLLDLQGVRVTDVTIVTTRLHIIVDVAIARRRLLRCSRCHRTHRGGVYDTHDGRMWRHLDLGPWAVYLRMPVRRLCCAHCDAVVTQEVPWAALGSVFTLDFEDLVSFQAQQSNRTAVSRLMGINWTTVGSIVARTVGRRRMPLHRRRLYRIGVDEISYRKHHKYLTIVADHLSSEVLWAGEGKSGDTLQLFLDAVGEEGLKSIALVSLDMSQAYISKLRDRLPHATLVFDPFHVVQLANNAIDEVRRAQVRAVKGLPEAKAVKKTKWILLSDPSKLSPAQSAKLAALATINRPLYRAYLLKESLRQLYSCTPVTATEHTNAWLAWARRSRLAPFVKLARTVRKHRDGILAAVQHGISNGRLEGLNNKIRLLSHRAYGFHSAAALIAFVYLCCSQINPPVPADKRPFADPHAL